MNKQNLPFWLITVSAVIILIVPTLIKDGMFMDGQQYACISKNLADGLGSFWHPFLCKTWLKAGSNSFLEHPPLVFGIQSLFFKVLGNSIYVERLYSFTTAIITAYLMILLWKLIFKEDSKLKGLGWLPVLLWICIPECSWSYQNNLQENTMGIFTLASVYCTFKALKISQHRFIYLLLSGIFIFLASLSKGVPGLFPIVVVGLYGLIYRNISFRKMLVYSFILIIVPISIYALLLLNHEAYQSLTFYFKHRLLYRIAEEPTVTNRFYVLFRLFLDILPVLIITTGFLFYHKIKSLHLIQDNEYKKHFLLFIMIGLAGSLPLTLTLVQRAFYYVPALPFFAIGFGLLIAPIIEKLISQMAERKKTFKLFKIVSIMLLLVSILISVSQIGKKGRDNTILDDVYLIGEIIPKDNVVSAGTSVYDQWPLQFYLIRHFNISLDPSKNIHHKYYMSDKNSSTLISVNYKKIPLMTEKYELYELQ